MKVAMINVLCGSKSTGKNTVTIYNKLKNYGFDVKVFYGVRSEENSNDPEDFVYFGNSFLFKVDHAISGITGLAGSLANIQTTKLFKELDIFKPDIIWLYSIHGGYVNEFRLLNYCKEKAKWTFYGMADEYPFLGKCCYAYDCDKYLNKKGCHNCPQKKESPKSLFFDNSHLFFRLKEKAYSGFDTITFGSAPYVIDRARKSWLLKDKEFYEKDATVDIENVYYPRDTSAIQEELGIEENQRVVILCASYGTVYKGAKYFHEAAKKCEDSKDIVFIHVGFDAQDIKTPSNMITIPYVKDQNRLSELLSLADAYVCTSIADAQPNACLNALGCGTPIIGFNISGVPYIATSEFGTYVEPFDTDQLANAIRNVNKKTDKSIRACHEYAKERYSLEAGERKYRELFDKLSAHVRERS